MAKSYNTPSSGNNGFCQDLVDLHNATTPINSDSHLASPVQAFSEAKIAMAKLEAFAEKPLGRDYSQQSFHTKSSNTKQPATAVGPNSEPQREPCDFYDWLMLSYSRMRDGDAEGAWKAACKTLEYDTNEPDLFVPLCQQFDPARRRQLANSAMQKTPGSSDAYQWLWVEVALSYWYEGNFQEACSEYETILQQKYLDPCLIPMLYNSLAMCYEALGRYKEAEQKYLEIDNRESVIKARARSGDIAGAVELMNKGLAISEPSVNRALEETLLCCLGRPTEDIALRISELLELDSDWPYKDFMLGVMQLVDSKGAVGYSRLDRFLRICNSSSHEWAVTLRWEIGVANDVLSGFGV